MECKFLGMTAFLCVLFLHSCDAGRTTASSTDVQADDLVEETGIPARRVMSALTMLQVRQLVKQHPGRGYEALVLLKEETTDRRGTPGLKP